MNWGSKKNIWKAVRNQQKQQLPNTTLKSQLQPLTWMQIYTTTPSKKSQQRREASCEHECYSDSRQIPPKGFRCQWDQTTGQLIQAWTNLWAYGGPHHCTHGQLSIASLHKHFTLHMNMITKLKKILILLNRHANKLD